MKLSYLFLLFIFLSSGNIFSIGNDNKIPSFKQSKINPYKKENPLEKKRKVIRVKKGMSFHRVAELLKKEKLIKSVFYFKLLAWIRNDITKIKSGQYVFKPGTSNQHILNILVSGKAYLHKITFPEGYNMYEIARDLEKKGLLRAHKFLSFCHDPDFINELLGEKVPSLEGYLFPDTYYLLQPTDPKQLIQQMVEAFFKAYQPLKKDKIELNRQEIVTLASIVEKETGKAEERALIASVFYNRLKKGMRLESDPTILYGMMKKAGGLVPLNIRKKDILKKTPYNTYRIFSLPLGPISNPGKKALQAVLNPEKSSFFYFVSRNDGSHVFSKTYLEHKKNVEIYQKSLIRKKKK